MTADGLGRTVSARMNKLLQPMISFAITLALWNGSVDASAQDFSAPLAPQPGVLLLRNGEGLSGKILRSGDHFYVTFATGECRVRVSEVEAQCQSLTDGYALKRNAALQSGILGHLDFVRWCIQHKLFAEAARELELVKSIDPRQPKIALLQRKLDLVSRAQPARSDSVVAASAAGIPAADDLDRLVRGMPEGAMATFTNTIQPLLLNNCTAAGCHGASSEGKYRWLRATAGRQSTRRLTQRNLHTTLLLLDREQPAESLLLTVPAAPHGSSKTAVFTDLDSSQYKLLAAWVRQVSQAKQPSAESVRGPDAPPLLQNSAAGKTHLYSQSQSISQSIVPGKPAAIVQEATPAAAGAPGNGSSPTGFEAPGKSAFKALNESKTPGGVATGRDPFDPEIFNRQHAPEKPR